MTGSHERKDLRQIAKLNPTSLRAELKDTRQALEVCEEISGSLLEAFRGLTPLSDDPNQNVSSDLLLYDYKPGTAARRKIDQALVEVSSLLELLSRRESALQRAIEHREG